MSLERKKDTPIYSLCSTIGSQMTGLVNRKVFLLPILSGTIPFELIPLFDTSFYAKEHIQLTPISQKDSIQILRDEIGEGLGEKSLEILAFMSGGIYRILQFIFESYNSLDANERSTKTIIDSVRKKILEQYMGVSAPLIARLHKVLYWMVTKERYSPTNKDMLEALCNGDLFLTEDQLIIVPPLFLSLWKQQWIGDAILNSDIIEKMSSLEIMSSFSDFERFGAKYWAFKQAIFIENGITKTTIGVFFRGLRMDHSLVDKELDLGSAHMRYFESLNDSWAPSGDGRFQMSNDVSINPYERPTAVWIGRDYGICDFYLFFPNCTIKVETKHSTVAKQIPLTGKSPNSVESEKKSAQLKDGEIFMMFSNTPISTKEKKNKKDLIKNAMILSHDEWKRAMPLSLWHISKDPEPKKETKKGKKQ